MPRVLRLNSAIATLIRTTDPTDLSSVAAGVFPAAEMKNSTTKFIKPMDMVEFNGTLTPGDFLVDAAQADSDTTWTASGSNPAVARYFGILANFVQQTALTGQNERPYCGLQVYVKLDYTVQWCQVNPSLRRAAS